eukprot:7186529-Prymnesium_polylepis.1
MDDGSAAREPRMTLDEWIAFQRHEQGNTDEAQLTQVGAQSLASRPCSTQAHGPRPPVPLPARPPALCRHIRPAVAPALLLPPPKGWVRVRVGVRVRVRDR